MNHFDSARLPASKSGSCSVMPMSTSVVAFTPSARDRARDICVMYLPAIVDVMHLLSICSFGLSTDLAMERQTRHF